MCKTNTMLAFTRPSTESGGVGQKNRESQHTEEHTQCYAWSRKEGRISSRNLREEDFIEEVAFEQASERGTGLERWGGCGDAP